jgi:hypothetical protein
VRLELRVRRSLQGLFVCVLRSGVGNLSRVPLILIGTASSTQSKNGDDCLERLVLRKA